MSAKTDVILQVQDEQFACDREVLRTSSPYFNAMFSGHFKELQENIIVLQDITPVSMKIIIESLTEDSLHIEDEDLLVTLQASCMLQFDRVVNYCVTTITEILSNDYCLNAYFEAVQLDLKELAQKALCVALLGFKNVIEGEEFIELNIEQVHHYLSHPALHCQSEIVVFEAALKWWYEHEKTCEHENQVMNAFECQADCDNKFGDKCSEILLYVLKCVNFVNINLADVRLMLTYPGISKHWFIENVLNCVLALKSDEAVNTFSELTLSTAQLLISGQPRAIPKLPCIVGSMHNPLAKTAAKNTSALTSSVMFYDHNAVELQLLAPLRHVGNEDGCSLEGYKIEVWKDKILLLGGEYMYGHGCWNRSCWMYDTTKDKWSKITTLPTVRRHFKSCIVADELFVIGGTGQFRVIQNNMDSYNLKTDIWIKGIPFPFEIHDVECCEYNGNLFITCGGTKKVETLLYKPCDRQWVQLNIQDPDKLYKKMHAHEHAILGYRRSYIPFVHKGNLYINGNGQSTPGTLSHGHLFA